MENKLREKILNANIEEHRKEAKYYNIIHTEIYNSFEQKRISKTLKQITHNMNLSIKILDIGCGTGNITKKLLKLGFSNIICVDISKEMLYELKKATTLDPKSVINSDIDSFLNINQDNFDLVVMSSVLHHLPNYEFTLKNLLKIINKGGVLYITHEPYRRYKNNTFLLKTFVNFLRKIDYSLYIIRYLTLMIFNHLKYLNRNCHYSDFHTRDRAIELDKLKQVFKRYKYKINTYATAKFSFFLRVLNKLDQNNMEIIIYKKEIILKQARIGITKKYII